MCSSPTIQVSTIQLICDHYSIPNNQKRSVRFMLKEVVKCMRDRSKYPGYTNQVWGRAAIVHHSLLDGAVVRVLVDDHDGQSPSCAGRETSHWAERCDACVLCLEYKRI